jgi:hypothetical protein
VSDFQNLHIITYKRDIEGNSKDRYKIRMRLKLIRGELKNRKKRATLFTEENRIMNVRSSEECSGCVMKDDVRNSGLAPLF